MSAQLRRPAAVDDLAPWPPAAVDGDGAVVRALAELERCAQAAAFAIEQERGGCAGDAQTGDTLHRLLCGPPSGRYAAASRLVSAGALRVDHSVVVLVADAGEHGLDDTARVQAGIGAARFARSVDGGRVLHAVWDDRVACLVAAGDRGRLAAGAIALGDDFDAALTRAWDGRRLATVGVGGVAGSPAAAATSYEQAAWAACVAGRLSEIGPVAGWDDLGVFQLLRRLDGGGEEVLPKGLRVLLACPNGDMLLETLEVYLDTGGDAQGTAARLFLARGSLYYRLRRIEEVAQVDLGDGGERLTLHLGLKLARLTGHWSGASHEAIGQLAS